MKFITIIENEEREMTFNKEDVSSVDWDDEVPGITACTYISFRNGKTLSFYDGLKCHYDKIIGELGCL